MPKQQKHTRHTAITLGLLTGLSLSGCGLTPEPLSLSERTSLIAQDKTVLFDQQETIAAPLTLYQAMARALKYNLDHRVKMMERAVSEGQSTLARYSLLPELVASAGYSARDNFNASNSRGVPDGQQSLRTSTSQDRNRYLGDLVFRWNILDFGVGYFSAQQEGNKALAAEENRRKVSHNLMQDVRSAYWRALSAQHLEKDIEPVIAEARQALKLSRESEQQRLRPPLDSLRYQKSLVEIIRRLDALLDQQKMAKAELAGLLNLPVNLNYLLAEPHPQAETQVPKVDLPMERMEEIALQMRPELRQEMYQTRISAAEIHKAMLRLLPGVEVKIGGHYDSNSYLLNQHFAELAPQIAKNVFELLQAPQAIRTAETQKALADQRRLAAHMAILTQVHLANEQLDLARKQYEQALELDDINQQILRHVANSADSEATSAMERIRTAVDAIMTQLQRRQSHAEMQAALGKLYVSLGFDPLPEEVPAYDVDTLAGAIETIDQAWAQGRLPEPTDRSNEAMAPEEKPKGIFELGEWMSAVGL